MSTARLSAARRRRLIEDAYAHAVSAMQPDVAVQRVMRQTDHEFAVGEQEIDVRGRLIVLAIGKAASPMARAAFEVLEGRIDTGIMLTKDGHLGEVPRGFVAFEASHPVPDERGMRATGEILRAVSGLTDNDVVLALISGGGSALLESPRDDIGLEDVQRVTDMLLRAGAPIQDLNNVRSELSDVKGGGLRRVIGPARTVSLVLSDVLGNVPEIIASGPTIVREPQPERAIDLIASYGLTERIPTKVAGLLSGQERRPGHELTRADDDVFEIIGDNVQLVDAFGAHLEEQGLTVVRHWTDKEGEAREVAREWVYEAGTSDADAVIGGGELTVTVRGNGVGGRNTEFALAAAMALGVTGDAITVASLASDGQDGSADAAGAIVDESSLGALRHHGVDPEQSLEANDSATALDAIGALVTPGPTGTNVNDVYVALRG